MRFANKIVNYWIKIVCLTVNIEAAFFKHGTRNVHHKRNQMTPIAMESLLAPVSFCQKNKYLHFQLLKVGQGHHVLTLIIWLAGVNSPCLRQKLGSSRTVVIATAQQVSFCFIYDKPFWCKVWRTQTALIFLEIFFIQYFTILVANRMESSLS